MHQIFTEETKFLNLSNHVAPTLKNAKKINIDYDTFRQSRYSHWYKLEKEYYYFKKMNTFSIINHLLLEKIAEKFYLDIVHLILAKVDNCIGLASLNFREPNTKYFYANEKEYFSYINRFITPTELFLALKEEFKKENNYYKLIISLSNLISYHIYTGLMDLGVTNILFKEEKDGFSLAPIYDLEYAFRTKIKEGAFHYHSCICDFKLPSLNLNLLLNEFPIFIKSLKLIDSTDILELIKKIEEENCILIQEKYGDYYKKQDEIKKDLIRSLKL